MREPLYRKHDVWWCRVRNPNGGRAIRKSCGTKDRKAAVIRWRQLERESISGTDPTAHAITLGDALDEFLEERKTAGTPEGTLHMYRIKSRQLNRVLGAEVRLHRVGAEQVDEYAKIRLGEGAERTTIGKERTTLSGALHLAKRRKKFAGDVRSIMGSWAVKYKPRKRFLSIGEIEQLLSELAPKRAAIVAFILATGATYPSELAKLTKADVNTKSWIVHVPGTKNTYRDSHVPIVEYARPWIQRSLPFVPFERWTNVRRELRDACARLSTCAKHRKEGEVRPVDKCKACERVYFAPVSPNDLRRTTGKQLRLRGVEPSLIGPVLRHKDGRMVELVYGKLQAEELAHQLARKLSEPVPISGYRRGTGKDKKRGKAA